MNGLNLASAVFASTLLCGAVAAQSAHLNVYHETDPAGIRLTAQLRGASGPGWGLLVGLGPEFFQGTSLVLDIGLLDDDGDGDLTYVLPADSIPADHSFVFAGIYKAGPGSVVVTAPASYQFGGVRDCLTLDFETALGADDAVEMVAGRVIQDQWADSGITVSARNNHGGHPDKAILFDSDAPTGGDDDLGVGLGNLLIVAENDVDADDDELVDTPDDEGYGGSLVFDFLGPTRICGVTLVDIDDDPGTELRFYTGGDTLTPFVTIPVLTLGDGSVQDVITDVPGVSRFEVYLEGSGAIGSLDLDLCPRLINFDENSVGQPLDLQVGEVITDQFADLGVLISVVNASTLNDAQNHPDKGILFDTQNPTGDDLDLGTPQPGVFGNDTPLGKVLIIAEDDFDDAPADGLVDDPDDEASGGLITFDFDEAMTVFSIRVLDTDESLEDTISLYDENDVLILPPVAVPNIEDGAVQLVNLNVSGVHKLVVSLAGSGAVTRLRFCPDAEAPVQL